MLESPGMADGGGVHKREMWQNIATSRAWYGLMAGTSEQLGVYSWRAEGRTSLTWVLILWV